MTADVEKIFFDVIVQLKEIDLEAYNKVLKYWDMVMMTPKPVHII